ncbi:hypothetical protein GLU64_01835 [Nanohaloarchaea archaeon]|nr:hypothetical protein [Candidatus Nanohaloarchaea archaeon]
MYSSEILNVDVESVADVSRAKFLVLSILLAYVGASFAYSRDILDLTSTFLGAAALILLHISVNSINSARDYKKGIDSETEKTDFSGGPEALVEGEISYRETVLISITSALISLPIFLYFQTVYSGIFVPVTVSIGLLIAFSYTDILSRIGLGEVSAGVGLGALPVLMIIYIQQGGFDISGLYLSLCAFIPTFNLLLINHFPDLQVDRKYGRKTLPIILGKTVSAALYLSMVLLFSILVLYGYSTGFLPSGAILALLSAPLGILCSYKAFISSANTTNGVLKLNVVWTHLSLLLLGTGLIIS